mmetsp:Transcript_12663/g.31962  ORF Transcript_12663/g.31962 Transcript_12663/m.31962 type:complete len:243 (+) Transcript_12663:220-948(+)
MQRDEARQLVVAVHHRQEGDLARVLHRAHRVHSLLGNQDGRGRRVHHLRDWHLQHVRALRLQRAAQVAVCEGAQQVVLRVKDQYAAAALARQLHQRVDHLHVGRHPRYLVPREHAVLDAQDEALADAARGVVHRVLVLRQVVRLHERDGHRVAEQDLQRRGRHGLLVVGAQLALQRQRDVDVAVLDKRRILVRRHCRQLGALRLGVRYKFQQLVAVALLKQEHQQVLLTEDTDVAVQRVGGR